MRKRLLLLLFAIVSIHLLLAENLSKHTVVRLQTNYGEIKLLLYPDTPKHRTNFIRLVKSGYYDGLLFHRVIANFMIQAGDPRSKNADPNQFLGSGDTGYTLPSEIIYPKYYHKHGALAAAREGDKANPKKNSSGGQFYIVTGHIYSEAELNSIENAFYKKEEAKLFQKLYATKQKEVNKLKNQKNQKKLEALRDSIYSEVHIEMAIHPTHCFTNQQFLDYSSFGGAQHLDGGYTVFGEVVEGLDIVDKISKIKTDKRDRPLRDVKIIKATIL